MTMSAFPAGQGYVGGLGRVTPRVVSPRMAGRTGANVRGSVLSTYLGAGRMDVPVVRLGMRGLSGTDYCTDSGSRAGFAVASSMMDLIGSIVQDRAGTGEDRDRDAYTAGGAISGAGDVLAAGYAAACAPAPGDSSTSPTVGSPTNAEITAMLTATRDELARARTSSTEAEMARQREAAAGTQRTQTYLMIGGGVALLALVAVVALRK